MARYAKNGKRKYLVLSAKRKRSKGHNLAEWRKSRLAQGGVESQNLLHDQGTPESIVISPIFQEEKVNTCRKSPVVKIEITDEKFAGDGMESENLVSPENPVMCRSTDAKNIDILHEQIRDTTKNIAISPTFQEDKIDPSRKSPVIKIEVTDENFRGENALEISCNRESSSENNLSIESYRFQKGNTKGRLQLSVRRKARKGKHLVAWHKRVAESGEDWRKARKQNLDSLDNSAVSSTYINNETIPHEVSQSTQETVCISSIFEEEKEDASTKSPVIKIEITEDNFLVHPENPGEQLVANSACDQTFETAVNSESQQMVLRKRPEALTFIPPDENKKKTCISHFKLGDMSSPFLAEKFFKAVTKYRERTKKTIKNLKEDNDRLQKRVIELSSKSSPPTVPQETSPQETVPEEHHLNPAKIPQRAPTYRDVIGSSQRLVNTNPAKIPQRAPIYRNVNSYSQHQINTNPAKIPQRAPIYRDVNGYSQHHINTNPADVPQRAPIYRDVNGYSQHQNPADFPQGAPIYRDMNDYSQHQGQGNFNIIYSNVLWPI